jgi:hypothetical protein
MPKDAQHERSYLRLQEILGVDQTVGEITAWMSDSPAVRASFRVRTENLAKTNRAQWNKTQFRKIEGDLHEIKWKADNIEWRAGGFDYQGFFVMVLGFTHKGKVYEPPDWKKTCLRRIGEVKNGRWKRIEFKHFKEKEPGK